MLGLIISVILFCFIVWGIPIIFLKKTSAFPLSKQGFCNSHFVITAKNAEESIEGIIRSFVWQISNLSDNSALPEDIFVIDLNSTDQTFLIIEKLAKEYPCIHPISKADYIVNIKHIE